MQLADSLLANYKKSEDLMGENGLLKQLTKMLVERARAASPDQCRAWQFALRLPVAMSPASPAHSAPDAA